MKLKYINVSRDAAGVFVSTAGFNAPGAKITVFLPDDLTTRILETFGPEIAREAQRAGARIAE